MSTIPSHLSLSIAEVLLDRYRIERHYVSENLSPRDLAEVIDKVLLPRLSAHADALEGALNGGHNWTPLKAALRELRPDSDSL